MSNSARLCLLAALLGLAGITSAPARPQSKDLNLQSRIGEINVQPTEAGLVVVHEGRTLTAVQYLALVHEQLQRRDAGGPLFILLNITTWLGVGWVALGLMGQLAFTGRMLMQWLTSEKARRSIVPSSFWWMSILGASMLLIYFVWRKDIVGVLGQSCGWAIYARNIFLIKRHADSGQEQADPTADSVDRASAGPMAEDV